VTASPNLQGDSKLKLRTLGPALALTLACLAPSCSSADSLGDGRDSGAPAQEFAPTDAGTATLDAPATLTSYCPSDKCPEGWTTCPNSRFPCDVNLRTDRENCGACGSRCPAPMTDLSAREIFECVEGSCAMTCGTVTALDCDGIVDNGCETPTNDPNNCGACGNVCTDPAKPCIVRTDAPGGAACGCPAGQLACPIRPGGPSRCLEVDANDSNCGACGNVCPSNPDGGALPQNAYHGCLRRECGHLKCRANTGDCNGDLVDADRGDGCETDLTTNEHCGACGNACAPGEACRRNSTGVYECLCPPGLTYCGNTCVDLATNPTNCGSCGVLCKDTVIQGGLYNAKTEIGICVYGMCKRQCVAGRADCNGNSEDGCEVNTNSDPRNCGGCGVECDAAAGQACVGGRCAVEPCEQLDGGPVTR